MRVLLGFALAVCAFGQEAQPVAETITKEEPAVFKAKVNLVMVPVVVRDKQGRAIGTLKQEDFQLYDKGKPQLVTRFALEKPGVSVKPDSKGGKPTGPPGETEAPERYV